MKKLVVLFALIVGVGIVQASPSAISSLIGTNLSDQNTSSPEPSLKIREINLKGSENPLSKDEYHREFAKTVRMQGETERLFGKALILKRANEVRVVEAKENLERTRGYREIAAKLFQMETRQSWVRASQNRVTFLEKQKEILKQHRLLWERGMPFLDGQISYEDLLKVGDDLKNHVLVVMDTLEEWELLLPDIKSQIQYLQQEIEEAQDSERKKTAGSYVNSLERKVSDMEESLAVARNILSVEKRFLYQIQEYLKNPSLRHHIARIVHMFLRVWNFELFSVDAGSLTIGKIVLAFLILLIGFRFSNFVPRVFGSWIARRMRFEESGVLIFQKVFYYGFVAFLTLFVLHIVKIPLTIFAFLGGAIALGLGFGAQNLLNNFISGLIILFERPFKLNDVVEIDDKVGRVMNLGNRCSRIRLANGVDVLVPNSYFLEKNLINWTYSDKYIRESIKIGVAYGSPVREVENLLLQAVTEQERVLAEPPPSVLFADFGDNALLFEVLFWTNLGGDSPGMKQLASEVRFRIDYLFNHAGIVMSFPQRDVHLDTMKPLEVHITKS